MARERQTVFDGQKGPAHSVSLKVSLYSPDGLEGPNSEQIPYFRSFGPQTPPLQAGLQEANHQKYQRYLPRRP